MKGVTKMDGTGKMRARWVGALILVAYSMLTYDATHIVSLGVITDNISGFAVIGIAVLLYPIFGLTGHSFLNKLYFGSRIAEGTLMVIGGILLFFTKGESYRGFIYSNIHIWFFIAGALFFYMLLYSSGIIPRFISIWGIVATVLLFAITVVQFAGIDPGVFGILLLPMVANEVFLAFWLMIKGFSSSDK